MAERLQAIRGMNDVLPDQTADWRELESLLANWLSQYGYDEIRFPYLERTTLFKRTIGEVTDILEKEMYTFTDLNGEQVSLRPEGTAGCVRACLEHGLTHNQQQRLWYLGPMFRHEKPQEGRYRQFFQFGVEVFGIAGVPIELELIEMSYALWKKLGVLDALTLEINTLGELSERQAYREELIAYFEAHEAELDEDSKRRLHKNPLRILDSKNPAMRELIENAPRLLDSISEESRAQFQALCDGLTTLGISYTINPFLVRGLDYYGGMIFEWVSDKLGSQGTVCAGGRYDKLVEQLGGRATSAIGFAIGIERLLLLRERLSISKPFASQPTAFFIATGEEAVIRSLKLSADLRQANSAWKILVNTGGGSLKNQFKKADKSGAQLALILGEEELSEGMVSIKQLRSGDQETVPEGQLIDYLQSMK